jgi:broad specificity phosphatase PhoE
MGRLVLVRHGQASFLARDYDQLSPLGMTQARALAEHWLHSGRRFDRVYTGTLRRQAGTAAIVCAVYAAAGVPWPQAVVLPGLDEFPAEALMRRLVPQLVRADDDIRARYDAYKTALADADKRHTLFRLLEAVTTRWTRGECDCGELPTFDRFSARVHEALAQVLSAEALRGEVAAFTSGGVIGVCLQQLHLSPPDAEPDLIWRLLNCSLTELDVTAARVQLEHYNTVTHLPAELHTHR